jgi:hypothetical protein
MEMLDTATACAPVAAAANTRPAAILVNANFIMYLLM